MASSHLLQKEYQNMSEKEEEFMSDERYILVKEIFLRYLYDRNDLKILLEDIEETFLSLWIFLNKKNPQIFAFYTTPMDIQTAEDFYNCHIKENAENKKYLKKLLISFLVVNNEECPIKKYSSDFS